MMLLPYPLAWERLAARNEDYSMAGNTRIFFVSAAYVALSICAADLWGAPKVSNVPELAGKSVVFVERKQFPQDHHNTANIFQLGEINEGAWNACAGNSAMYKADFDSSGNLAAIRKLVSSKDGIVRDPEISFDAKKIVFSMRENLGGFIRHLRIGFAVGKICTPYARRGGVRYRSCVFRGWVYSICVDSRGEVLRMQQAYNVQSL